MIRSAALLAFFLALPAGAQLATPGRPASAASGLDADLPLVVLPRPDVAALRSEDAASPRGPWRYGVPLSTSIDSERAGLWEELPSGELVWRVRILAPGALSLGVTFDRFEVPAGGRVFLYDPARRTVLGAYTEANEQPNGMLAIQPLAGDEVVIEYVHDAAATTAPELRVGEVVYDYRDVLGVLVPGGAAEMLAGCLVDINCPSGAPYQDIKRSVIMVLMGGGLCSAGMLNNTANDAAPYFLTANHCGGMTNVVAVFDYERTGCASGSSSQSKTLSGATLIRASSVVDSQLYRLLQTPPASYEPFYAGWDRRTTQPAPAISISHPGGKPKKLALDNDGAGASGFDWSVQWEMGTLQGGSSGSPLFNGHQRVLGPACCVLDFTCNGQIAAYGRFGSFWDGTIAAALDPQSTNPLFIDGHDPFNPIAIPYHGAGGNPFVYTSTTPPGVGTTWNARIDAAPLPSANKGWILGYLAPDSGTSFGFGEFLVDLASPQLFISITPVVAGISQHSNPIPNFAGLIGLKAFTQGMLQGGSLLQLTNGIELRLR